MGVALNIIQEDDRQLHWRTKLLLSIPHEMVVLYKIFDCVYKIKSSNVLLSLIKRCQTPDFYRYFKIMEEKYIRTRVKRFSKRDEKNKVEN